jgi:hypothetical protein
MIRIIAFTMSAALVAALGLSACGSGQDRTANTIQANDSVAAEVKQSKQDLDQVVGTLRNLRDAGDNTDLKKIYAELKDRASAFDAALAAVQDGATASVAAGKSQLDAWHTQSDSYSDPALRDSSAKRQADLRLASDALATSSAKLNQATGAYKASLNQTINALDQDLSQPGIAAIKPTLTRIIDGGPDMQTILADVSDKSRAMNAVINP